MVVLAVPHEQAARLIPAGALPPETVDGWAGLGAAPIVNLHVRYDRKVMDVPFAAAVDSPVQWVFDRTRISGMHARGDDGQYLAVSLSAADPYVNMSVAELREMFVPALAALFPEARAATVTEFFVTRERRATFRQVPGTAKLRPKSATALPGLVAGRLVDRHRLARHDGGRRPQRPQRRHRPARPTRARDAIRRDPTRRDRHDPQRAPWPPGPDRAGPWPPGPQRLRPRSGLSGNKSRNLRICPCSGSRVRSEHSA